MQRLMLLAATAVLAAGCASATASRPDNGAAAYVPGDALMFVGASRKAPDWFPSEWKRLEPAVGRELDVAVLKDNSSVAFTQPSNAPQLAALVHRHALVSKRVGDWTAVASTQAALDQVGPTALSLADNNRFRAAMERVPGDALVHVYASGARAQQLLASVPGQLTTVNAPFGVRYHFGQPSSGPRRPTAATLGMVDIRWAAASVSKAKGGYRVDGVIKTGEVISPGPPRYLIIPTPAYAPVLLDEIPADVLAVVDFPVPVGAFELLDELPPSIVQLFGKSFDLAFDLDTVMRGETALYVRAGAPPEVTLVTQPNDIGAAEQTLEDLQQRATRPLTLYHASIGGELVVSTSKAGIEEFRGAGTKLSDDPAFRDAKQLSGLGDQVVGLAYVRVSAAVPLLKLAGVELPDALPTLGSALGYGAAGQNERTFTTFVQAGSG